MCQPALHRLRKPHYERSVDCARRFEILDIRYVLFCHLFVEIDEGDIARPGSVVINPRIHKGFHLVFMRMSLQNECTDFFQLPPPLDGFNVGIYSHLRTSFPKSCRKSIRIKEGIEFHVILITMIYDFTGICSDSFHYLRENDCSASFHSPSDACQDLLSYVTDAAIHLITPEDDIFFPSFAGTKLLNINRIPLLFQWCV